MINQFKNIYEKQYSEYGTALLLESKSKRQIEPELEDIKFVRKYIDGYIENELFTMPIREDAKFLLLSGLHLMYIKPYRASKNSIASVLENDNFENNLGLDIDLILETSARLAKLNQKSEISGHIILQAVNMSWDKMRMSSTNIWG